MREPGSEPDLWPETAAARDGIEALLSDFSREAFLAFAQEWFAPNVALDEPLIRRVQTIRSLARIAGTQGSAPTPLRDAAASSTSPARVTWSKRGHTTSLRCSLSMTPEPRPRIQELRISLV